MSKTIPTNQNDITERVEKTSLVDADQFLISDSADNSILKRVQKSNVIPVASETVAGIVERATDAEASAGTDTERFITPAQLSSYGGGIGMVSNLGNFTRTTSDATGSQAYPHGLGTTPKLLTIKAVATSGQASWSEGYVDDDTDNACFWKDNGVGYDQYDGTRVIRIDNGSGVGWLGAVTSMDSTNFTISWTRNLTGLNITILWIAQA